MVGVLTAFSTRRSRAGNPYGLGRAVWRWGERYVHLPLIAFGGWTRHLEGWLGKPLLLVGSLEEVSWEGFSGLRLHLEEALPLDLPTFRAPLGHPCTDGEGQVHLSGYVATDPQEGALFRLAVFTPAERGVDRTLFVTVHWPGGDPAKLSRGQKVYLSGVILPPRDRPEATRVRAVRVFPGEKGGEVEAWG